MKRRLRKQKGRSSTASNKTMPIPKGAEIRQMREDRSISVRELASKAGVSYQAILRWENESGKPHPKTVRKVLLAIQEFPVIPGLTREEPKE